MLVNGPLLSAAEDKLPMLMKENFENGMDRWETTDPDPAASVWKIIQPGGPGNHVLRVTAGSTYRPKYRSPYSIALLKDVSVGDFILKARVQSTNTKAGGHRDLCIFWGYQDPNHFYYVHLGAKADPHACQIFIVNDAPRKMITVDQAEGTPWDDDWHNVKVVRRVADGTMEVYFDDMKKPFMTARDKTFLEGRIGVGTFDDNGNFDNIVLQGELSKPEQTHRFRVIKRFESRIDDVGS
ncbi:MAG: hypothetical protein WD468_01800 [Pirellulales bacterium]